MGSIRLQVNSLPSALSRFSTSYELFTRSVRLHIHLQIDLTLEHRQMPRERFQSLRCCFTVSERRFDFLKFRLKARWRVFARSCCQDVTLSPRNAIIEWRSAHRYVLSHAKWKRA